MKGKEKARQHMIHKEDWGLDWSEKQVNKQITNPTKTTKTTNQKHTLPEPKMPDKANNCLGGAEKVSFNTNLKNKESVYVPIK